MDIKQFLIRLLLFAAVAIPLVAVRGLYSYFSQNYQLVVNGNEIYLSLKKSKTHKKVKVLIIGDSVAKQLYDNETYNGNVYSLACNQAVSIAGQYILLKNFLEANNEGLPERVVLIFTPTSFTNNLDQKYTFHYFLKPFYTREYRPYFNQASITQIKKIPYYYLTQFPFIKNTDWTPDYHPAPDTAIRLVSPVSGFYLSQIKALCRSKHIQFTILPAPVKARFANKIKYLIANDKVYQSYNLSAELGSYFKDIIYRPDSLYQDDIHFKKQYIPKDYFNIE